MVEILLYILFLFLVYSEYVHKQDLIHAFVYGNERRVWGTWVVWDGHVATVRTVCLQL